MNKVRFDTGRRELHFSIGDLVLYQKPVRNKGLSQKLLPHYVGPYEVIKRCDYVTYRIKKLASSREEVAHVENLKP